MNIQELQSFKERNKNLFTVLLLILIVFLVILSISTLIGALDKIKNYIAKEIPATNTIMVSATGEVYVKPDLALIDFSVITEEKTVSGAMTENTKKMNKIIDEIKKEDIEEKDLKTTYFNIRPRYEWHEKTQTQPQGERVLVGYEVNQTLQVKIREMEKIGQIIEKATAAGTNKVSNLQLTVENQDEFKKQAREQAIEKAKNKAKEITSQLGVKLGKITNFSESGYIPYFYGLEKALEAPAGLGEVPEIEIGENKITVTVVITYEIR